MEIGMLWFDNDPEEELANKVARAAAFYTRKYGELPNLCLIHPSTLDGITQSKGDDLELRSCPYVLPNHFWIGMDRENFDEKENKR